MILISLAKQSLFLKVVKRRRGRIDNTKPSLGVSETLPDLPQIPATQNNYEFRRVLLFDQPCCKLLLIVERLHNENTVVS